jgi:cytochrome c-type biogenesis protein CcmF
MPIVVCILFLMAVAPILPWRQSSPGLVRTRLFWPAAFGVATVVAAVIGGARGLNPLLAFGLGAFAGVSALRQLLVEVRRRGWAGLGGPSGGGMVVHLGVVLVAVAFAASHSYSHQGKLPMSKGQTVAFDGHSFTYLGTRDVFTPTHHAQEALIRIDGGPVYAPAVSDFPFATEGIGTPSVDTGVAHDIYLTLASTPSRPGGPVVVGVIIEPLVAWIWIGGGVMLAGTALAIGPRRKRRRLEVRPTASARAVRGTGAAPPAATPAPAAQDAQAGVAPASGGKPSR